MNLDKSNRGGGREKRRSARASRRASRATSRRVRGHEPFKPGADRRQGAETPRNESSPKCVDTTIWSNSAKQIRLTGWLSVSLPPLRQARQRCNPFSSSESVVSRAEAILLRVRSPGSRVPRSRSEICTSWTPDCSARSICRQFRALRSFLIRSPVAAQRSFAMRSSSG
jgi:hypothetical protein